MKYAFILVILTIVFSKDGFSQAKTRDTVITIINNFDEEAVAWFHAPGKGSIKGNAKFKSKNGDIRFGKQFAVELMPFTHYTEERLSKIYKKRNSGFIAVEDGVPKFSPDPEAYHKTQKVYCDEKGNFEFKNLPKGEYYVIAFILWENKELKTGGGLMRRLSLSEGQLKNIKMNNL